jgi:hypothetical protein
VRASAPAPWSWVHVLGGVLRHPALHACRASVHASCRSSTPASRRAPSTRACSAPRQAPWGGSQVRSSVAPHLRHHECSCLCSSCCDACLYQFSHLVLLAERVHADCAGNLLLSVSSRFTGLDTLQQIRNFAHVRLAAGRQHTCQLACQLVSRGETCFLHRYLRAEKYLTDSDVVLQVLWSLVAVVVISNLAWFMALYNRIKE